MILSSTSLHYDFTGTQAAFAFDLVTDATAIKVRANAQDERPVEAIAILNDIMLMTETAEIRFGPGNQDPVTPTNNGQKAQSYNGSNLLQTLKIEDAAIYASNKGPTIRDIRYNSEGLAGSSYGGRELSVLAGALFEDQVIVDWAVIGSPESAVIMVTAMGHMVWMSYHREHNVVGFTTIPPENPDDFYRSVAVLSEGTENGIYLSTERLTESPLASTTPSHRHIERMSTNTLTRRVDESVYMDTSHHLALSAHRGELNPCHTRAGRRALPDGREAT